MTENSCHPYRQFIDIEFGNPATRAMFADCGSSGSVTMIHLVYSVDNQYHLAYLGNAYLDVQVDVQG